MRIGLYDVDSKIPNLVLMKLSAYHKQKGDQVEFYSPLFQYDKIYASKIFINSDKGYLRKEMEIGGSGFNLDVKLPTEIEHIYPDYFLYNCKYSMGFITRGCIRNCPFCIVPQKEGFIKYNAPLEEFCKEQKEVMLLDNNILAYKDHIKELEKLRDSEKKIDFNQGLDIRLITEENVQILSEIKMWKQYRFALDNPSLISIVEEKLELLKNVGIQKKQMRFYILIGFDTNYTEDIQRIDYLQNKKIDIFVMPYIKTRYTIDFARWVNRFFYKYQTFKQYIMRLKNG